MINIQCPWGSLLPVASVTVFLHVHVWPVDIQVSIYWFTVTGGAAGSGNSHWFQIRHQIPIWPTGFLFRHYAMTTAGRLWGNRPENIILKRGSLVCEQTGSTKEAAAVALVSKSGRCYYHNVQGHPISIRDQNKPYHIFRHWALSFLS